MSTGRHRTKERKSPRKRRITILISVYILLIVVVGVFLAGRHYARQPGSIAGLPITDRWEQKVVEELLNEVGSSKTGTSQPGNKGSDIYLPPAAQVPVVPSSPGPTTNTDKQYTPGDLETLQQKVTPADRERVMDILRQRLSVADISQLIAYSRDGVTSEEKQQIKTLLLSRLTPGEVNEIADMYLKYR